MKYLELAKKQFFNLKDEILNEDPNSIGAESEEHYELDGRKLTIKVDGFWEKSTWFGYKVYDEFLEEIESGSY